MPTYERKKSDFVRYPTTPRRATRTKNPGISQRLNSTTRLLLDVQPLVYGNVHGATYPVRNVVLLGFSCKRSGLILMVRGGWIRGQDCQMYARIFGFRREDQSLTSVFLSFLLSFPGLVVLCRWLYFRWNLVGRSPALIARSTRCILRALYIFSFYSRFPRPLQLVVLRP